jgi:PAS domain S-box-containing protein
MMISITGLWNILVLTNQTSLSNPDLTPCVFAFSELLFAWACFRLRLSDIASAAHKIIIDHMTDPILVLDLNNRVIEINPAGQKLLNLPSKKSSGQPVQKIFPDWERVIAKGGQTKDILFDLEMERSGQRVYYELRLTTLRDLGEYKAGRLLILHDITDRVRLYDEMQNLDFTIH